MSHKKSINGYMANIFNVHYSELPIKGFFMIFNLIGYQCMIGGSPNIKTPTNHLNQGDQIFPGTEPHCLPNTVTIRSTSL